ncbi:ABC transporter permease [Robinsoniella peoriensis]|uniref:ABC transporter permease n=1 Tax=Robinsoniella peoriensis TaxID=180332 RepID=UPI00362ABBC7
MLLHFSLIQASIYGIMACGMTFAIIGGDFDLSVGSIMALSGLISVLAEPYIGQIFSIMMGILSACLLGLVNGFLIAKCHISSFIATIGTSYIIKGIALKISDGNPIISKNSWYAEIGNGKLFGIPFLILLLIALVLITWYILTSTRFGRNIYTMGGNSEVAHNSGINIAFYKISVFILSGLAAGIAGILNSSKLNTASALHGDNAALSVITGVVIGGTSLIGGVGSIGKSIIGILIFSVITNALDLLGVFSYYQTAIRGILLILIIGLGAWSRAKIKSE